MNTKIFLNPKHDFFKYQGLPITEQKMLYVLYVQKMFKIEK